MHKAIRREWRTERLSKSRIEIPADKFPQNRMHPELFVEGHPPVNPVFLLKCSEAIEEILEHALLNEIVLAGCSCFSQAGFSGLERPDHLVVDEVGKLPMVANEADPPPRLNHGNEQIPGTNSCGFVDNHCIVGWRFP